MAGNGEGETDDLCDIGSDHSGCEHDEAENVAAMRELKEDAAVATAQTTRELKRAMSSRQSAPSARQVTRATRAIAESGCASPTAEMQEEALLLLIRQRKQDRSKRPRQLRLEGVGEATCQDVDSDSAASDNSAEVVPNDRNSWVVQNFAGTSACITVLEALREVHDLQEGKSLGQDRSISLVLMHPTRIDECQCVRCKWHLAHAGDLPEVIWVSWLNNSPTYGVTGRRARQVLLDTHNKVIFSTANTSMAKTGIAGGLGQPELLCDYNHSHVLCRWVGAAMRKVKKSSPDRDQVPGKFLIAKSFYERMVSCAVVGDMLEDCRHRQGLPGLHCIVESC